MVPLQNGRNKHNSLQFLFAKISTCKIYPFQCFLREEIIKFLFILDFKDDPSLPGFYYMDKIKIAP
jgi:hypothetical protein